MRKAKIFSLSAAFLLIFAEVTWSFPSGIAHGESASQVPPPEGFGPYSDGWINRDIPRTGGGILQISVHYPAISSGQEAEPNATEAPYPTLLLSPGYMMAKEAYWSFAGGITSWGFFCVIVASDPRAGESERANDLIDALNWLDEQNDNSSFELSQLMDESKFGVLGHSLGGTATIMASGSEPRFKVSVPIAPFVVSPGLAANIHVPILIVVGSDDTICPPNTMSYPLYNEGNPPKLFLNLTGVDHLGVVFGFMSFKYVISFLKLYLYEDQDYADYLYGATAQQEIDDGKIKLMYDLRRVTEHQVLSNGVLYTVLTYSNSTLLNLVYNQTLNQMNFTVTGPPETTGIANITIPKQLVPSYDIKVYLDGESYSFTLTQNSTCYFVYLMYTHSQHQITISFVDLTPPILTITSPSSNSAVKSSSVTVSWNGSDVASGIEHYEVSLDDGSWIEVGTTSEYTFSELADGSHTVYVRAFDKDSNWRKVSVSFIVDTAAPILLIGSPSSGLEISSSNVVVTWSGSDGISGIDYFEVKLDGGSWINVGNDISYTFSELADGNHTVYVKAADRAGNPAEAQVSFTVKSAIFTPTLIWVQWWFWAIIGVAVVFSVIIVFCIRRRKLATHDLGPQASLPT